MARGALRIYLGAAPGVGKTYSMLSEAHRRLERGTDVVVGFVETYGRPRTEALLQGLESVPCRDLACRGGSGTEMDVDAILARHPAVALVGDYLQRYRAEHRISSAWRARERIVVGLTGGPEGRTLLRRAARMAAKGSGSEILAVYVGRSDGLTLGSAEELAVQRTLVEDLGGSFHHVIGDDMPTALLDFARGVDATQIVLASWSRRARCTTAWNSASPTAAQACRSMPRTASSSPSSGVRRCARGAGVGLGLAVARGFAEAVGARWSPTTPQAAA